ncbi:MAG: 16S rRNA (uracil(1498)-N(3))-methyltransferase [Lachnospiraceae bacterium]|nr:16S rRNA (uracil(1498)-N(3))-methyltransferase [Lachnospiraceae bacterium]
MHHFFVKPSQIRGSEIIIEGSDVRHIRDVLRMKAGEELSVSNGTDRKEYRCGIREFRKDSILCRLHFIKEADVELPSRIYLFQGLPKGDKMELIVQKAVELGVYEVIPVDTARSVVKLDARKEKTKITRWQGIAEAAAKQSRRGVIPRVREVMSMEQAIACAAEMEVRLIPYELAESMACGIKETRQVISSLRPGQSVALFIGPEGGFEEGEVEAAMAAKIQPISLGRRILRTETAGLAVLSWIMYQLEE